MDKQKYFVPTRAVDSVDVPGWGKTYIRSLTMADAKRLQTETDELKSSLLAIVYGVCDEAGNRIFDETDMASLEQVPLETTAPVVQAVVKQILGFAAKVADAKN